MTSIIPIKTKDDGWKGAVVCSCYHCGEKYGASGSGYGARCAIFCKNCRKAEQRKEMDDENLRINPDFVCKFCVAMAEYRKKKRDENKD